MEENFSLAYPGVTYIQEFFFWQWTFSVNKLIMLAKREHRIVKLTELNVRFYFLFPFRSFSSDSVSIRTPYINLPGPFYYCCGVVDCNSSWPTFFRRHAIAGEQWCTLMPRGWLAEWDIQRRIHCAIILPHICHTIAHDSCVLYDYCNEAKQGSKGNFG